METLFRRTLTVAIITIATSLLSVLACVYIMADIHRMHAAYRGCCCIGLDSRGRPLSRRASGRVGRSATNSAVATTMVSSTSQTTALIMSLTAPAAEADALAASHAANYGSVAFHSGDSHVSSTQGGGGAGGGAGGGGAGGGVRLIKLRQFADKSGPFLLFHLNLAVMLLSLTYAVSASLMISEGGNGTAVEVSARGRA
jgi:hypothetical protein